MTYQKLIIMASTIRPDERSAPGRSLSLSARNCLRVSLLSAQLSDGLTAHWTDWGFASEVLQLHTGAGGTTHMYQRNYYKADFAGYRACMN